MAAELLLTLAAGLTALIGRIVIGPCGGWIAGLSLGFAAGAGVLSLQVFLYKLLHLPANAATILLPWLPAAYLRLRAGPRLTWPTWPKRPDWVEAAGLVAMLAAPALWFPYERTMPLTTRAWDAWAIWLFKAKAFYLDAGLDAFLERTGELTAQPSYPLLVPLYGTFLYTLTGGAADHLAKLASPLFFFAVLGGFYTLARRFASRPAALVFTAMLANLHMVNIAAFELAGYADTALSVYMLLGGGFLYAWLQERQPADLALASLFSALAAWTKNEGLFFLALVAAILLARRARWSAWVWPALAVLPWILVRRVYDVPGADLWTGRLNWANLLPGLASFRRAFDLGRYNLAFWSLAAAAVLYRRAGLDHRWLLLPALVAWQLAGLLGAYLGGRNEIGWWIATSLDRVLAQVAPLALLASAVAAGAWLARLTPQETSRNLKTKRTGAARSA